MLESLCCFIGVLLIFLVLMALSPLMFFGLLILTCLKYVLLMIE